MMNYAYYYLRLNCNRDNEIITLMQHFTIIETSLLNTKEYKTYKFQYNDVMMLEHYKKQKLK